MKQHGLYKVPRDPGHLGGYLWKPTLLGFLLLLFSNVLATQFVSYRFRYQRALGPPLLRAPHFGVYQPWAWAHWLLQYASHPDPRIRLGILSGPLIVVTGCVTTMGIFAATNLHRTKKLSENMEDLHGSARWATADDVRETGLLAARQGVYIGGWYNHAERRLHYLRDDGPAHVLVFAPTRSGKGVGLVIPTLLIWPESCVVYHIKGENWAKTAGFRQEAGPTTRDQKEQEHTNWHSLVFYGPLADIAEGFKKGDNIFVEGTMQVRQYTPVDGHRRTHYEVVARTTYLIAKIQRSNEGPAGNVPDNRHSTTLDEPPAGGEDNLHAEDFYAGGT